MSDLETKFQDLEKRVKMLESVSKNHLSVAGDKTSSQSSFSGLQGGIRFLICKGFFNEPKTAKEVWAELRKEGYYHSYKSVDKSLRIDLMQKQKILARVKEDNVWKYVLRK